MRFIGYTGAMSYDFRDKDYTFKHIAEEHPEQNTELFTEHFHTSYEILYFLRGRGKFIIQQNIYEVKPHNLLVIRPGAYHNLLLNSHSWYERIVLRFSTVDIPTELHSQLARSQPVYNVRGTRLEEELKRLAIHHQDLDRHLILPVMKNQLNIILAYLCQCSQLSVTATQSNPTVERIITYISENLTTIHNMDQIAENLRMSRSLLQKRFYQHLQTPVMAYVRTQKCILAQELLMKGEPATSCYLDCGFNDYSSFYRSYLKVFGHPPTTPKPRKRNPPALPPATEPVL